MEKDLLERDLLEKDTSDYIDPCTDTGFKRLFNDKAILISFLNEVLPDQNVSEVVHVEQISSEPSTPTSPRVHESSARRSRSVEHRVRDLSFPGTEDVGHDLPLRLVRFDIVCITQNNTTIIVEMQKAKEFYFMDRLVYYAARQIIKRQGWTGKSEPREPFKEGLEEELGTSEDVLSTGKRKAEEAWDYHLYPVFVIAVCDFEVCCLLYT
jgi:hypothetical protein